MHALNIHYREVILLKGPKIKKKKKTKWQAAERAKTGTEAERRKRVMEDNLPATGKDSIRTRGHFVLPSIKAGWDSFSPSYQLSGFVVSWSSHYRFPSTVPSGVSGFVFIKLEPRNEIRDLGATYLPL